jgi:hypothetical protein
MAPGTAHGHHAIINFREHPSLKIMSVTETFERFLALELASTARLLELTNDIRTTREALELEIAACNATFDEFCD